MSALICCVAVHLVMNKSWKGSKLKKKVIHFAFPVDEASYFIKVVHFTCDEIDLKANKKNNISASDRRQVTENEADTLCK